MIGYVARLRINAAPEAERLREHQGLPFGGPGQLESAQPFCRARFNPPRHDTPRTTWPVAAERMQSLISAKATVTPILPGA